MSTHTDEPSLQALESVLPKLNQLEERLAEEREREIAGLDKFRMDEKLEKLEQVLEEQCTEFDALHFVGQASMEAARSLWGSGYASHCPIATRLTIA